MSVTLYADHGDDWHVTVDSYVVATDPIVREAVVLVGCNANDPQLGAAELAPSDAKAFALSIWQAVKVAQKANG